ncbi:MAG: heme biosynthesis HemY N-terminal domain-containing protein [Panacagrimonas sp.]
MIRSWLVLLLALAAGAALAYYLRADTGYVLIHYGGWSIETSLLALLVAALLGAPLVAYGARALLGLVRLPVILLHLGGRRRAERALESFESGLLKLLEGHWQDAEVELVRRAADHRAPHLNYLAAARAAQRLGAAERRDHYLELAARGAPQLAFATGLTRAELQRERGEFALAKVTALGLREADPSHPYPVELLAECHAALGEWNELHGLLTHTEKLGTPPPMRRRELLVRALSERLDGAMDEARLDGLKQVWQAAPAALRNDPDLRLKYASGLARLNAHAEASALIASTLSTQWDADLANLFGQLHAADPLGQLASIEHWLTQYGEKPELLITAGRACLANKLWGKARSYLEAVIRLHPTPAAYLELARLAEQTHNAEEATRLHRQGLELASR